VINKRCGVAKNEGPYGDIGNHNIMVDTEIPSAEKLSCCGDRNGSDCPGTNTYDSSADVEGDACCVEK
jgi:hypothetical protein